MGSQEVYAFESEDGSSSYDSQLGYRGFTVHEGWAYYLATEPGEGSYSIVFDDEEMAEPEPCPGAPSEPGRAQAPKPYGWAGGNPGGGAWQRGARLYLGGRPAVLHAQPPQPPVSL